MSDPTTTTTTAPPQAWHRLHHAATDVRDEASRVLREQLPGYEWPADVSIALGEAFRVAFDVAFQAGRDSRGPIADEDRLWAIHHRGSDDIMAVASRAIADELKATMDARDATTAAHPDGAEYGVYHRVEVVEWPFTPAEHAEELSKEEGDR